MRVFVYEYLCGGAVLGQAGSTLRTEGWAMLSAVLEDLCRCPGTQVVTRLDPALIDAHPWPKNLTIQRGRPGVAAERDDLRELARTADYTLLIAPEFQDILGARCQWVEEVGGKLLGPSSEAVRLTADKLRLAEHLRQRGVATPLTVPWSPQAAELGFPLVVKPRDGAGSQATFFVQDEAGLRSCPQRAAAEGWTGELIAQPYLEGFPASVAFVLGPGGKFCLKPAWQDLSNDGRFRYRGGEVGIAQEKEAKAIAVKVLTALTGLRGWFGVDVLLNETGNFVVEINPRLTTSFVGLRRLAKFNLMELLLGVASSRSLPLVAWKKCHVCFQADGTTFPGEDGLIGGHAPEPS